MATAFQTALVNAARAICADNNFRYYDSSQGESNLGPYTFDCATFNSYTIYQAMGWSNFPDSSYGGIGYFWPWINQTGFDQFLLDNGWTRYSYSDSLLTEGAIIITDITLHHSLMYLGNGELADANNYFGYGNDSIAVRTWPTYSTSNFYYIYIPPNVTPGTGQPDGIGSVLTNAEVTSYYNSIVNSGWSLSDLKSWVQSQPFYSWVTDDLFYLMMGWSEGEGYFSQSLEGSYLCGCCPINNCYHAGATDYASFKACMYLPDVAYYSYANMISRGQNASAACVAIMTLAFANPNTEVSLFYSEGQGWQPSDYISYSPLCYDGTIQIWAIPHRGWTLTITGTGVRTWTPGPGPTPTLVRAYDRHRRYRNNGWIGWM